MDVLVGYNEIKLAKEDQDDTAFITYKGVFPSKFFLLASLMQDPPFKR